MSLLVNILECAAALGAGAGLCFGVIRWRSRNQTLARAQEVDGIFLRARKEAEDILRDARLAGNEAAVKLRLEVEQSFAARHVERVEQERRLSERESLINIHLQRLVEEDRGLQEQKELLRRQRGDVEEQQRSLTGLVAQARDQLRKLAGMSDAEAREAFLKRVESEACRDANSMARHILEDAKARAEEKARLIISTAIQRYAGDHTYQNTTAIIAIQGDDMKGRIIGREGRNIRAFEAATGITVLIDDTPGAVLLSGFDPVRREIAREAMVRLIQDGRIHPTRIEEVVAKVSQEIDETIMRLGDESVVRAGLAPVHPEIVKLLGRLHFRHSYSQNILDHSVEVAHLTGLMAAELGIDVMLAKRAGLLHDIGKAVGHDIPGPHAVVGSGILQRWGESDTVVNAVGSHHNEMASLGPIGVLVSAADAISASRPGARSENLTTYVQRVENLEKIASSFPGVEKAYALQAGRELRVFVLPGQMDDDAANALARSVASRIENELQYPGQIKITVIRETRCIEWAK